MASIHTLHLPDLTPDHRARLSAVLDGEERERAARFALEANRDEFIAAHGLTRLALGRLLGRAPEALRFAVDEPDGKPRLLEAPAGFDFNLSHTSGMVACVAAPCSRVGIDVECVRECVTPDVATPMFAIDELAWLDRQKGGRIGPSVLDLWTLKEAYIKALGKGLSLPTTRFSVRIEPPGLIHDGGWLAPGEACRLQTWRMKSGHLLALAIIESGDTPAGKVIVDDGMALLDGTTVST